MSVTLPPSVCKGPIEQAVIYLLVLALKLALG